MASQTGSSEQTLESRDRDSVPIVVVVLGPARGFVIALAVLAVTLLAAMLVAFLAYG